MPIKASVAKKTSSVLRRLQPTLDHLKHRWQIELFFKWIKQHLKIKSFWGYSANAVKTQIWIAIAVYVIVAISTKTM